MSVPESPDVSTKVDKLRSLVALITSASETIISEWEEPSSRADDPSASLGLIASLKGVPLLGRASYEAQRVLVAAAGAIEELVCEPQMRIMSFAIEYFSSRALHIAAQLRVADLLAEATDEKDEGVPVEALAEKTGIDAGKLARVLRCLTSEHIFREVGPDRFANNSTSQVLVGNEPLRSYIMLFALDIHSAADYLPVALNDPVIGHSDSVDQTAFNLAVGTDKTRWAWLEEKIPTSQARRGITSRGYPGATADAKLPKEAGEDAGELVQRPEMEVFGQAMMGAGRVVGTAHLFDFPWKELGQATVVDVGGGVGGFDLQLSKLYPELSFVIQDRPAVVEQGKAVWAEENPAALATGKVRFMAHDFFTENPVKGADIYWLRYIIHDWADSYAISILSHVRAAMSPSSRVLITESVVATTLGDAAISSAPPPLPANYGRWARFAHQRDLTMLALLNGIERTPDGYRRIVEAAGLRVAKVWECRSHIHIIECRLP